MNTATAIDYQRETGLPLWSKMIPLQWDRHLEIIEHSAERLAGWKIHLLEKFFDIRRLSVETYVGSFAWSSALIHTRWLYRPVVNNYGGGFVTPADLARDYLSVKYPNRKPRCTTEQWQAIVEPRHKFQMPILCQPGIYDNASYLDLSGAFWQIIRAVGWDVDYMPLKFLRGGKRMTDFPYPDNKMARNCLVSIGLPTPLRIWDGKGIFFNQTRSSKFVNIIAWRLVTDVLNGIALDMHKIGAKQTYTDSYLVEDKNIEAAFDVLDQWGLEAKIKHNGRAILLSGSSYAFEGGREGYYATKNFDRKRRPTPSNKVYDPGVDWLRPRFKKFADRAKCEWEWLRQ